MDNQTAGEDSEETIESPKLILRKPAGKTMISLLDDESSSWRNEESHEIYS